MKAMILAAGRGTRMRPLTDHIPKPLIEVGGKSLIEHHITNLVNAGVQEIVINVSYRSEQIEAHLGDGKKYHVSIQYSYEPEALETGGGIKQALPFLGQNPFIIVSADVWTDYPFQQLPQNIDGLGYLILVNNPGFKTHGDFGFHDGKVRIEDHPLFTYSGISVLHPELFVDSKENSFALAKALIPAIKADKIAGEIYQGDWVDVGTEERLENLRKRFE